MLLVKFAGLEVERAVLCTILLQFQYVGPLGRLPLFEAQPAHTKACLLDMSM